MKQHSPKCAVCVLLALLMTLLCVLPAFAAEEAQPPAVFSELKDPSGGLLVVSKYGDTQNYPEQSCEGILAAAESGADMIYVTVRKTSDGFFVLMADETLQRMCVDSLGNTAEKALADVGYHELSTYHLRAGKGGLHEKITASTVPTLLEVAEKLSGKALLLMDGVWDVRDEIYTQLSDSNLLGSVVFVADGDKKEVKNWLSAKQTMPLVISRYDGNVVFSAKSVISKTLQAGAVGTWLSSGNPYSVVYSESVLAKFSGAGRAVIDMTDPAHCGKRADNPIGWNDVTARGYSVLITENITELCEYRARVLLQKERLQETIEKAQNIDVTLCSTESVKSLKKAIGNAKTVLASSVSENSLTEANYDLRQALSGLTNQTEGESGKSTVTAGRVAIVIAVVAALIILEVVLESARRKKVQKRKKQRERDRKRAERENNGNTPD